MQFTADRQKFHKLAQFIDETIGDTVITVNPSGRAAFSVDQSDRRSVIHDDIAVPESFFKSWKETEEKNVAVDFDKLARVLQNIQDKEFSASLTERGRLNITAPSGFSADVSLLTVEGVQHGEKPGEIEYGITAKTTVQNLKQVKSSCEMFSDKINFEVMDNQDGERMIFGWVSGDQDDVEHPLAPVDPETEGAHTMFDVSEVERVCKHLDNDQTIDFKLHYNGGRGEGRSYPAQITTELWGEVDMAITIAPQQNK